MNFKEIKRTIADGNTKAALDLLISKLDDFNLAAEQEILIYSNRLNRIEEKIRKGIIDDVSSNREMNKIVNGLVEFIDLIDNSETGNNFSDYIIQEEGDISLGTKIFWKEIDFGINNHLSQVIQWSENIKFRDMAGPKNLDSTYIDLDFYFIPDKYNLEGENLRNEITVTELVRTEKRNVLIYGHPGAGKTTSMKKLAREFISNRELFNYNFPILIKLREIRSGRESLTGSSTLLYDTILDSIGFRIQNNISHKLLDDPIGNYSSIRLIDIDDKESLDDAKCVKYGHAREKSIKLDKQLRTIIAQLNFDINRKTKREIIDKLEALIILDGFDELTQELKEAILVDVNEMCQYFRKSKLIITSRLGELNRINQDIAVYQLCPLSENQIAEFIIKWMNNSSRSKNLIKEVKESVFYDTTVRPLTLAHICALYERKGKIPNRSVVLYDKIINLLLEEWDEQRNIIRDSKFEDFDTYEKKEVLSELAFHLTTSLEKYTFTRRDLTHAFSKMIGKYNFTLKEVKNIVRELESHTGILIASGYESYQFSHKSLQEFLCADYMSKSPYLPHWEEFIKMSSECALLVNISSRGADQFVRICLEVVIPAIENNFETGFNFFVSFSERLFIEKTQFYPDYRNIIALLSIFLYCLIFNNKYINSNIWQLYFSIPAIRESVRHVSSCYKVSLIRETKASFRKINHNKLQSVLETALNSEELLILSALKHIKDPAVKMTPFLIIRKDWI